jgi:DNA polymerase III delta subunit
MSQKDTLSIKDAYDTISLMLYVYFGGEAVAVRQKAISFVNGLEEKGFTFERIDSQTFAPGICSLIAGGTSLFGEKNVYILDTPSSDSTFNEEVLESLEMFQASQNAFVLIETSLLAPAKKLFAKYAETVEEVIGETVVRFNAFALADSLSLKDKKTLWLQLQDAKASGLSAEEIIGTLWWQLKTLRIASLTKSAEEAGMKDFPYNKAKRALRNFSDGELEELSRKLLTVYHDGHLGKGDIDFALERFTLTL